MTINIHVTISNFSFPYFEYMKQNYLNTATKHKLIFYCYCLDDESYKKSSNVSIAIKAQPGTGTTGHCNGIKEALSNLKNTTHDSIDIISDCDTVMLANSWDVITENILKYVGILGTSYERIGGYSSGNCDIQTYKNKPNATWIAMSKKYDFSKMDMKPDKGNHLIISNEELSELYQLPIGYKLLKDSGWQIPSYLKDNNIPYKSLVQEKPTDNAKIIKTGDNCHEEYHLDGEPFLAHQRGSLSRGYRQHQLSKLFYNVLDEYFLEVGIHGKTLAKNGP